MSSIKTSKTMGPCQPFVHGYLTEVITLTLVWSVELTKTVCCVKIASSRVPIYNISIICFRSLVEAAVIVEMLNLGKKTHTVKNTGKLYCIQLCNFVSASRVRPLYRIINAA